MISIVKVGGDGYVCDAEGMYHEYICDAASDVSNLPDGVEFDFSKTTERVRPRPGSRAVVADGGAEYILSPEREWKLAFAGIVAVEETAAAADAE